MIWMSFAAQRRGLSSTLILRFPSNFVCQLSIKARRNCSNIGVAQVVEASWTSSPIPDDVPPSTAAPPAASALDGVMVVSEEEGVMVTTGKGGDCNGVVVGGGVDSEVDVKYDSSVFSSDESILIHVGERYGRRMQSPHLGK